MARRYRVLHKRRKTIEALFAGGRFDCYIAQASLWIGWRQIGEFATREEAERACFDHAGGTLLPGGARVVAEFERPD